MRAEKSDLRDETPRGRDPGELAVAAEDRDSVLAENAEELRKLGKRAVGDVIEIGRRLSEMKNCLVGPFRKDWLRLTDRRPVFSRQAAASDLEAWVASQVRGSTSEVRR